MLPQLLGDAQSFAGRQLCGGEFRDWDLPWGRSTIGGIGDVSLLPQPVFVLDEAVRGSCDVDEPRVVVEALSALCRGQPESSLRHTFYVALENSGHATDGDVLHPGGEGH